MSESTQELKWRISAVDEASAIVQKFTAESVASASAAERKIADVRAESQAAVLRSKGQNLEAELVLIKRNLVAQESAVAASVEKQRQKLLGGAESGAIGAGRAEDEYQKTLALAAKQKAAYEEAYKVQVAIARSADQERIIRAQTLAEEKAAIIAERERLAIMEQERASQSPGGLQGLNAVAGRGSSAAMIGRALGGGGAVIGITLIVDAVEKYVKDVRDLNEQWRVGEVNVKQYWNRVSEATPIIGGMIKGFDEAFLGTAREDAALERAHKSAEALGEEIKSHAIYLRESAEAAKQFAEEMAGVQNQIKNVGLEGTGGQFAGVANRKGIASGLADAGARAASAIQSGVDPEKYIKAAPAELAKNLAESAGKFNKELEGKTKRFQELNPLVLHGKATEDEQEEFKGLNASFDRIIKDRQEDQLRIAREFAEKNREQIVLADAEEIELRRKANLEYNQEYLAGKIRLGDTQQEAQETALRSAERYYQADIAAMRHALQDKQKTSGEERRKSDKNLSDQLDSGAITQAQYTEQKDAINRQFENQGAADTDAEAAKEAALNRSTLEGQTLGRLDSLAGAGNRAARLAGESFQIKKRYQGQRDALNAVLANGNSTHADQDNALKLMRGLDDQQERELRHSAMRDVTYTPFAATSNIHSAGEARNLALQAGANAINFNRQHDDGKISDLAKIMQDILDFLKTGSGRTEELLEH